MSRLAPVGCLFLLLFLLGGCGTDAKRVELTMVRDGSSRPVAVEAWALPEAGRVAGLGGVGGEDPRVAQRQRVSRLAAGGSVETVLALPPEARVTAISRHGRRIAVQDREGLHVGRAERFDPDSTALASFASLTEPDDIVVYDGHPARIFEGALWDLDVPERPWFSRSYGQVKAVDPTQRRIAVGDEEGRTMVISAQDGHWLWNVPRASRAPAAAEISAVAISVSGEVATLDRAGWVGCGSGSIPALPLAPAGMPAAIAQVGDRVWATRGGIAAFVDCSGAEPELVCEVRSDLGDPRSARLLSLRGRVYAGGMATGRIVVLPPCR